MITYTPADLVELGEEPTTVTCPYCGKDIELTLDDESTEIIRTGGATFHADCIYDLFTISDFLQYLSAKNQWQEYIEWLYDIKFNDFTLSAGMEIWRGYMSLREEIEIKQDAIDYIDNDIEDYLEWWIENVAEEKRKAYVKKIQQG